MSSLRSLYVDLNSFFASCEQQETPALRGKPVAVVPVMTDSTAVIAASYAAKAFGIKTGTRVGDAKKMCPGLILRPARHGVYVRYHHAIIDAVESVIPVRAVCSIDEIACELTGSQRDPDRARALALKVKEALRERAGEALTCSIGLAPNYLLAKIASDMQKPDGLTMIESHELPERLYSLKLQDIPGIGHRMEARLWEQGIRTVRELLERNEAQARGAWGSVEGSRLHFLLSGNWADFGEREAVKSIGHQHVLPPRQRNLREAALVAQRLLAKAAIRLRKNRFRARRLGLAARLLPSPGLPAHGHYDEVRFHETQDTSLLIGELGRMLRKVPKGTRFLRIGVVLADFVPQEEHQISFFENPRREEAFRVMDKINERYGRDTLHLGSLHEYLDSAPTRIAFSRIPGLEEVED